MKKVYLDSNVFIALIKSEIGKPFRLMFKEVEEFFQQCPEKQVIVVSDLAAKEIEKIVHYSKKELLDFFRQIEIKTVFVETTEKELEEAIKFRKNGMHGADALHAAIATSSNCNAIVTYNKKHFEPAKKVILVKEPADFFR